MEAKKKQASFPGIAKEAKKKNKICEQEKPLFGNQPVVDYHGEKQREKNMNK